MKGCGTFQIVKLIAETKRHIRVLEKLRDTRNCHSFKGSEFDDAITFAIDKLKYDLKHFQKGGG